MWRKAMLLVLVAGGSAACEAADGVELEPLPPLERPTPEQRARLPEVTGAWHFAGWEVASEEVGQMLGAPEPPGELIVQTQRLDSVAGFFVRGEVRLPLVGEVRRDSIIALASLDEAGGRFAAGRIVRDTLWLELSTLPFGELSLPTVRWAFVRSPVGQAFLRLPSGVLLRDTVVALPPEALPTDVPPAAGVEASVPEAPGTPPREAPPVTRPAEPAAAPPPAQPQREPQPDTPRTTGAGETQPERPRRPAADTAPPADTVRPLQAPGADIDIPRRN